MSISQEKGKISALCFTLAMTCYIQGTALISTFYTTITSHETWLVIVVGFLVFLPTLFVVFKLIDLFPGKNLIEMNDLAFGPALGKIMSLAYMFFYITLASLNLIVEQGFVATFLLPQTPVLVTNIMFMLVCAFAVRGGIKTLFNQSTLFVITATFIIIVSILLNINNIDLLNLFPVFQLPKMKYIQATHMVSVYQFIELTDFLMFVPFVTDPKKVKRSFFYGILFGAVSLLIIIIRDTVVLGNTLQMTYYPSFQTFRMIDVGDIISRSEFLFAIILDMLYFFKISILYYVVALGISQIFHLESYKRIVLTIGIIIVAYSSILFQTSVDFLEYVRTACVWVHTVPELIFPLVTILVVVSRRALNHKTKEIKT